MPKIDQVTALYRSRGYTVQKTFPGEYVFLFNPETLERVRIYFNGSILEYR